MYIEDLQAICKKLPGVTEDVKWENHLTFCVGDKMFLVLGLDVTPVTCSFKVSEEDFEILSGREGCTPAPYLARYKWIYTSDIRNFSEKEWKKLVPQAYQLIREKLPVKKLKELGIDTSK
jgi:predicted DNA-binding protein (MmcQ/YjbR family)